MPQFRAVLQGIWTQPQAQALTGLHHRTILAQVRLPQQLLRQVQAMATYQKLLYQLMHRLRDTLRCPRLKPRLSQLLSPLCMLGLTVWRLPVRLASLLRKVSVCNGLNKHKFDNKGIMHFLQIVSSWPQLNTSF